MTNKCSKCGEWFDEKYVCIDSNNNKYCPKCLGYLTASQKEKLLKLIKEGKSVEAIKALQKYLCKTNFYDKFLV